MFDMLFISCLTVTGSYLYLLKEILFAFIIVLEYFLYSLAALKFASSLLLGRDCVSGSYHNRHHLK